MNWNHLIPTALLVLLVIFAGKVRAGEDGPEEATKALARATVALIEAGSRDQARVALDPAANPLVALGACDLVIRHFYWQKKDLPVVVEFAGHGIASGRSRAEVEPDAGLRDRVLLAVKVLAYNLASFTWPGWGEEGIVIREEDRKQGIDAAELNLRLAEKLERGPQVLSAAFWMIGAHQLTDGRPEAAVASFRRAGELSLKAGDAPGALMNEGYVGIGLARGGRMEDGAELARKAVAGLRAEGSEDATFYADQVAEVFERLLSPGGGTQRIQCGPVVLALPPGESVALFHIVDQLSALAPRYHRHLSLEPAEEEALARYAQIRRKKGIRLERFLLAAGPLDDGLFAAAEQGVLEPAEVIALTRTFSALHPRVEQLLAGNRDALDTFRKDLAGRGVADAVAGFAKFTGTESLRIDVYPVPTPGGEVGVTRRPGLVVIEVPRAGGAVPAMLHEIAAAILAQRGELLAATAGETPGLSVEVLTESISAAFAGGLDHHSAAAPEAVRALGLALRPVLLMAMEEGSFEAFLKQAGIVFNSLSGQPAGGDGK